MGGSSLGAAAALVALSLATPSWAARQDASVLEFLGQARTGTARFRDPTSALVAGYRPIGPETPAMGQHWLNPALLVEGRLDPASPQVLEYATIAGHRTLVGVAYAIPLGPSEAPPDQPLPGHLWHTHEGTVDEESLASRHDGSGSAQGDRVAVLHAWVWLENPAGPFAAENWALPYVRLGLAPPREASAAATLAAQALALGSGPADFSEVAVRLGVRPDSGRVVALVQLLSASRDSVIEWRRRRVSTDSVSATETAWLTGVWTRLAETFGVRERRGP
ncbi:MAG TPA: hypothetical protein VM736_06885 [Gemmatimonadales bacterium]|nr:hypothetical protein [Gemmatimonadales bacterium]